MTGPFYLYFVQYDDFLERDGDFLLWNTNNREFLSRKNISECWTELSVYEVFHTTR